MEKTYRPNEFIVRAMERIDDKYEYERVIKIGNHSVTKQLLSVFGDYQCGMTAEDFICMCVDLTYVSLNLILTQSNMYQLEPPIEIVEYIKEKYPKVYPDMPSILTMITHMVHIYLFIDPAYAGSDHLAGGFLATLTRRREYYKVDVLFNYGIIVFIYVNRRGVKYRHGDY